MANQTKKLRQVRVIERDPAPGPANIGPASEPPQPPQMQVDLYSVIGQKEVENGLLRGELQRQQQLVEALQKGLDTLRARVAELEGQTAETGEATLD